MSIQDNNRLLDQVQHIADSIANGYYDKDCLEVMQEDNLEELNTWYVYYHTNNEVIDNEWFETEKEAQDYLEAHQGVLVSAYDYLQDALDIEYVIGSDKRYLGARVLVAFGGPNIWINTRTKQVEGYWWGESAIVSYNTDEMDLDSALEDLYNC
jgi:hypothetical protein